MFTSQPAPGPAPGLGGRSRSGPGRHRRWLCVACMVSTLVAFDAGAVGRPTDVGAEPPLEYRVKAAFLLHFLSLVTWPPSAFPSAEAPFRVAVVGADPFRGALEQVLRDRIVDGRRVELLRAEGAAAARGCHIVFVHAGTQAQEARLLEALAGGHALLVGESGSFLAQGGMVQFRVVRGMVRFSLNVAAAARARLRLSSRMVQSAIQPVLVE
jgi:hypothetical protein